MASNYSDYVQIDKANLFKREAQAEALRSTADIGRLGLKDASWTIGESVHLIEDKSAFWAHVNEGLGTKNLVADEMFWCTDRSFDANVAKDTVAMIVNDGAPLGAVPVTVAMHAAAGSTHWFNSAVRRKQFLLGWREACDEARCLYRGGETPIVRDMVKSDSALLSGSMIGIIRPKSRLIRRNIRHGDGIVILTSSGVHANGLTLARKIAEGLREGYRTKISDGRMYGEALLDPTHIYVGFVEDCLNAGVKIHYGVNITGHGWRKFMRAPEPFTYVIEQIPTPQPVFDFIAQKGNVSLRDMYADYNMGAGFALYVPPGQVSKVIRLWQKGNYPFQVFGAGHIEKSKKRRVVIERSGFEPFEEDELQVR